jgi:hypothetical protein
LVRAVRPHLQQALISQDLNFTNKNQGVELMRRLPLAGMAGLIVGCAIPALAGEVAGNSGGMTPIENLIATADPRVRNAICAYSGLEDVNGGPGITQTPHSEGGVIQEPGVARVCSMLNHGRFGR